MKFIGIKLYESNVRMVMKEVVLTVVVLLNLVSLNGQNNVIVGGTTPATVATPTSGSTPTQQKAKFTVIDGDGSINNLTIGKGGGQDSTNTALGNKSLYNNLTTGVQNTGVGFWALRNNTSGAYNTALGSYALRNTTTGQQNTAVGRFSMLNNVGGGLNTALGLNSLFTNTFGNNNTAIGLSALNNNSTGSNNVALGMNALDNNTTGSNNIAIGYNSDVPSPTASNQLSIGNVIYGTGVTGGVGAGNVMIGTTTSATIASPSSGSSATQQQAKFTLENGDASVNSITLGKGGGQYITNTAFGFQALYSNTTGQYNTGIGWLTLTNNQTGINNIAVGNNALFSNSIGSNNIGIGLNSLYLNTTGVNNLAIGNTSMQSNTTGHSNTAIGLQALVSNTEGTENTALGWSASQLNETGIRNLALGYRALHNVTTGSRNIAIGYEAIVPSATSDNQLSIGNLIYGTGMTGTVGAGNVGIGTSDPQAKLHVAGNSLVTGNGEVQGTMKIGSVNQNNAATEVLVRNADGTVGRRDATTLGSGVPSSGIILSEIENNTNLINAGFSNIGFQNQFEASRGNSINFGTWVDTISEINCPSSRTQPFVFRSGSKIVIWGSLRYSTSSSSIIDTTGAIYDINLKTWTPMSSVNAPNKRRSYGAVIIFESNKLIVWAGLKATGGNNPPNEISGAMFDLNSNSWQTINTTNAPNWAFQKGVYNSNTNELIIWGGSTLWNQYFTGAVNTGAKYNFNTNTWTSITLTNAPSARIEHVMVWTGSKVIVYCGINQSGLNLVDGKSYDPNTDVWTSILNAPAYIPQLYYDVNKNSYIFNNHLYTIQNEDLGGYSLRKYDFNSDNWFTLHTFSSTPNRKFTDDNFLTISNSTGTGWKYNLASESLTAINSFNRPVTSSGILYSFFDNNILYVPGVFSESSNNISNEFRPLKYDFNSNSYLVSGSGPYPFLADGDVSYIDNGIFYTWNSSTRKGKGWDYSLPGYSPTNKVVKYLYKKN